MDTTQGGQNNGSSGNGSDNATQIQSKSGNNDARERLMNDMQSIISDAENWLKTSGTQTGADMLAMKEKFETTLRMAKDDLIKLEANMLAKTRQAAQATDLYVNDNPWKAVGLGGAIGVIFGLLLARR